jgi:hypothetical protein
MNKWDESRWSEIRAAQSELIFNFDRLSQEAGRAFSSYAQEDIRTAAEQFILEAFSTNSLPAKNESRLCLKIVNIIDKALNGTLTQRQMVALHQILEQADFEGLELPRGVVQRALRRPDDLTILKELSAAAETRSRPPQSIDPKTHRSQTSGARGYLPFSLFATALYRIYSEAGGATRYTHHGIDDSFSSEAIDFITEAVSQTCAGLNPSIIASTCPSNQGRAIARVIDDYAQTRQL